MIKHHRRSIRLKDYDYSQSGHYFITICTHNQQHLFGEIKNDQMILNQLGQIIQIQWLNTPKRYHNILLDKYIVMPNHLHGIIEIRDNNVGAIHVGAIHELPLHELPLRGKSSLQELTIKRRTMLIPKIIGYFKMNSAKQINQLSKISCQPIWQRNYYEHIIRDEKSLNNIREYITNNPLNWERDRNNLKDIN